MTKLLLHDLPVKGKKVLMRVDFNVPLDDKKTSLTILASLQRSHQSALSSIMAAH